MKSLFYRLIIYLNTANESDTNYNIAWYMANNFVKITSMSISQLAKECYVSPATISRFCRAIGYENYAHLKQECTSFASDKKKFNNLIDVPLKTMKNHPAQCTELYSKRVCEAVGNLSNYLDWSVIDQVLQEIHDTDTIVFFGTQFSHSAALHLQTDLLMLEKFTVAYIENTRQLECAKTLDKNSLAIIISVNGFFVQSNYKILQYLKKSQCKVVLITNNPDIKVGIDVNYTIILGASEQRRVGKHTLLTTMELMSLRYYSLYYPEIREMII